MEKFNKFKYKEPSIQKVSDFQSTFTVSPLERGFGNTIGTAIRRVLLSSVSGVAMFAIKIKGVQHEFQTMTHIKDDVVQLIFNLKGINITYDPKIIDTNSILKITLKAKEGEVLANQLEVPAGLTILNPNHHITQISKTGKLEIEIFIKAGRGFVSFDQNKENLKLWEAKLESKLKSGQFIAVDSDFSPVELVSYSVEKLNTKSVIEEEKLIIDLKTNGTRTAKDILAEAADILSSHLSILGNAENITEDIFEEKVEVDNKSKLLSYSISSLDLSVRSYNSLKRAGIEKISDLAKMSHGEINTIKNLGKKSLEEILEKLVELGIKQGDVN